MYISNKMLSIGFSTELPLVVIVLSPEPDLNLVPELAVGNFEVTSTNPILILHVPFRAIAGPSWRLETRDNLTINLRPGSSL